MKHSFFRRGRALSLFTLSTSALLALAGCGDAESGGVDDDGDTVIFGASSDPDDYIRTPAGMFHRSCVHSVPAGATVNDRGRVTLKNGQSLETPPCLYPARPDRPWAGRPTELSTTREPTLPPPSADPTINGWVAYSSWFIGESNWLSRQSARFVVPDVPPALGQRPAHLALLYYFPGIMNGSRILQPVLQFGNSPAGGGANWAIASWSCNDGSACYHGPLVTVGPGDVIDGSIQANDCGAGGNCTWQIHTGSRWGSSELGWADGTPYTQATGGALEVYGLTSCDEIPVGPTVMTDVAVFDQQGSQQAPAWTNALLNVNPSCAFDVRAGGSTTALYHLPFNPSDGGPFVGCFEDGGNRALPIYLGTRSDMTPAVCRAMCKGHAFAGVQFRNQCFCGDALGYAQLPAGECNTACDGNRTVACGGPWRNSVYNADPAPPVCDPQSQPSPEWGERDGACLPSCGLAGGSQCASDACAEGLAVVGPSYDCPLCCG
jgi:hypothetical protein